jgi:hypothetical protein
MKKLKQVNKERALQGKTPHFAKKREQKESKLRDKFDELEKKGKLE